MSTTDKRQSEFTDAVGRTWSLFLNVNQLRKVRERTGWDGAKMLLPETLGELQDPCLLVDVLYQLLEPQIVAKQLTAEQFAEAMTGQAIEQAMAALISAAANFLPPSQSAILMALWDKAEATQQVASGIAMRAIESLDPMKFGEKLPG